MTVLIVAQFMDLMDTMITNVALPSIQRDLAASPAELEWTLSAYVLLFATLLVTGGRLGDIVGRKRVFLVGTAAFTLASFGAALAQSGSQLVLARGVQGAGAALMVPQVLSTAQALYRPEERGKIFGLMGALGGLGVLAGQLLGGWLVTSDAFGVGWRAVFVINVPVGLAILALAAFAVPDTRSEQQVSLDVPGVALATSAVLLAVYPLIEGNGRGWPSWMWAMFAGSAVALALFLAAERARGRAGRSALMPMHLFGLRGFAVGSLVQIANFVGWGSFALMIPLYVQQDRGFSAFDAGLIMLPVTVGSFIGTAVAPLAAKMGRSAVVAGGLIEAAGFAWYGLAIHHAGANLTVLTLTPALFVTGVGMIMLSVPLMRVALDEVAPIDAGAASGTFSMFQQLGNALGVAVVGVVFFGGAGAGGGSYEDGIVAGNWLTVAAFGVAAVAGLALPRRRLAATPSELGFEHTSAVTTSPAAEEAR